MSRGFVEHARRELASLGLDDICAECGSTEADCTWAAVVTPDEDVGECPGCGRKLVDGKPVAKKGRIVILDQAAKAMWAID